MIWKMDEDQLDQRLSEVLLHQEIGKVTRSLGLLFEAYLPGAAIGSICQIFPSNGRGSAQENAVEAEVVGFKEEKVLLMPFEEPQGIHHGSAVSLKRKSSSVPVGDFLLGRVLDGCGLPIDSKGPLNPSLRAEEERSLYEKPTHPLDRQMVTEPLDLGVRSINGLLTCGKGQRMGIMAGSGVGKSVLLGMMARQTEADVNVIALIGERGREVREFIERDLGPEGLKKSVVIVSTSDKSPILRMRGAFLATSIAEYFRDQGKNVLFLMDSVTRFCMAQREIGLSLGEPPSSKGYTPSVFAMLPKLLERAGMAPHRGSITGLYTVLVEGDDMDEPIADAVRSILDGHIVLSRKIAQKNHFPAVDVLQSASRVMRTVIDPQHLQGANQIKEWLALYQGAEDLINVGAYVKGANSKIDQAIYVQEKIIEFLRQGIDEKASFQETLSMMHSIIRSGEAFQASQLSQQQRMNQSNQNSRVRLS